MEVWVRKQKEEGGLFLYCRVGVSRNSSLYVLCCVHTAIVSIKDPCLLACVCTLNGAGQEPHASFNQLMIAECVGPPEMNGSPWLPFGSKQIPFRMP